jgi:hypothetical protein
VKTSDHRQMFDGASRLGHEMVDKSISARRQQLTDRRKHVEVLHSRAGRNDISVEHKNQKSKRRTRGNRNCLGAFCRAVSNWQPIM